MAIQDIILLGDKRLHEKAAPVRREEINLLQPSIQLMFETIIDIRNKYGFGRAIAAPQIGLPKRIICLNADNKIAILNPELSELSEEMFDVWDDCMSFPNLLVRVKRHKKLKLNFVDTNWQKHEWILEDDMAELIQHEYDHLEGILATQRAISNKSFQWRT